MSEFVVGVRVDGTAAGLAKAALEAKKALDNMAVAGPKTSPPSVVLPSRPKPRS